MSPVHDAHSTQLAWPSTWVDTYAAAATAAEGELASWPLAAALTSGSAPPYPSIHSMPSGLASSANDASSSTVLNPGADAEPGCSVGTQKRARVERAFSRAMSERPCSKLMESMPSRAPAQGDDDSRGSRHCSVYCNSWKRMFSANSWLRIVRTGLRSRASATGTRPELRAPGSFATALAPLYSKPSPRAPLRTVRPPAVGLVE
mmetsp:Transcript_9114/g.23869  ORF Transcript_9114/g.23869 Transcript_9114/m.23869 type:complete len:204 (-) Transcript_9114:1247-1858(-)